VEASHRQGSRAAEEIGFCSYCGRVGGDERQRVCRACGLGVQLRTDADALKSEDAPFLIVRADGTVSAMSASAEKEFGDLVARQLPSVLESPDLPSAVATAAEGNGGVVTLLARPLIGRRFTAKARVTVAPCGDPPAALVVVERA
jgi:ribosomal protein L37E